MSGRTNIIVCAALCMSTISGAAGATSQVPATDLDYSVVDGQAVITGCGGHDCRNGLIIPSTITTNAGAIPVRHIADNAFEYPEDDDEDDGEPHLIIVGTVIIPDSVTSIGQGAFTDQRYITNVVIGDGVQTIGDDAFRQARALTSLTLGTSVTTIGAFAFINATISAVTIPDSVIVIGEQAFRNNAITSLTLGSGVQTIDRYAFTGNRIGHVVAPASLTTLGDYSFASNSTLTSFLLEGPVPTGTAQVFTSSPNLTEILYRPVHTYPATWAGLPTRGVARPPQPPTEVAANPGDTMATVTWSAPATSDATVTAYTVMSTPNDQTCVWSTGPLTCEVTGLTNGTAYTFTVVATSAGGTSTSSSASTPVVPLEAAVSPPSLLLPLLPVVNAPASSASSTTAPATTQPATTQPVTPSAPSDPTPSIDTIRELPLVDSGSPVRAIPGQPIGLTASGFTPGETVHLVIASTPQILTSGAADDTGAVSLTGTVPTDLAPGDHTLALYAPASGHGWRQSALVSTTLPRTGDALAMILWSLLLLAMGGVLWLMGPGRGRSSITTAPPR